MPAFPQTVYHRLLVRVHMHKHTLTVPPGRDLPVYLPCVGIQVFTVSGVIAHQGVFALCGNFWPSVHFTLVLLW